jgi:hypothetical protein
MATMLVLRIRVEHLYENHGYCANSINVPQIQRSVVSRKQPRLSARGRSNGRAT